MRILITGGAGSLGTNLIDAYAEREGVEILTIDNYSTGHRESLPDLPNVQIVDGTIADAELVSRTFESFGPTHVIHCAASYKDPDDWEEDARTNVMGMINVIRASQATNVKRFVNFQTALCYGIPESVPIRIDHPCDPISSYSISKNAGEQILMMSDLNAISFRLASVIAPRMAIGPIPTFYQRLKARKSCFCSATVRDFMDLTDFLALMDIAIREDAPGGVFNASPGTGVSIKEIFDEVADYLEIEVVEQPPIVPPGDDDVPEVVLDPSKTEEILGWSAKVPFHESLRKMLKWYDVNGVTAIYSHVRKPSAADN